MLTEIIQKRNALPASIPEIIECKVADNIGNYGASFIDICLISLFENKAILELQRVPKYDEVVAYIQTFQEAEEIVDFKF